MNDWSTNWTKIKPAIPHLYFAIVALLLGIYNQSFFGLLFALPFLKQIVYPCKVAILFISVLAMICSFALLVAAVFMMAYNLLDDEFFVVNIFATGAFLITNVLMSVWLFRDAKISGPSRNVIAS
ncbi:hypothetical protein [Hufsiella ginkgonis]|uniref:Uncharacterized protein n=1 Tax=Hufsiella ginkgonis TaxID=2695274 RepID=A0A7K1XRM2_9SPHI|nr:hypothetical protein [Hufsiella ginkgonis]MXV13675.1 hypothetical protein [Hufsiella ginkgonis]